jgi:hypothetical protein
MCLILLFGCKKQADDIKQCETTEITSEEIQNVIDFIKSKGYKITILPPRDEVYFYYSAVRKMAATKSEYYEMMLSDISFNANDKTEDIYNYLLSIKNLIIEREEYINSLKPNPIIEHLNL